MAATMALMTLAMAMWMGLCALFFPAVSAFPHCFQSTQCIALISETRKIAQGTICSLNTNKRRPNSAIFALSLKKKENTIGDIGEVNEDISSQAAEVVKEVELMHRTAKMMEDHRRSQEAAERTLAMMEELSTSFVVGKSKGVKVTFDGQRRPIRAEIDPNFLFSSFSQGVIPINELNEAITDAMKDGYELSGKLMEEKMKGLYEQLGLPREPPSFSSQ